MDNVYESIRTRVEQAPPANGFLDVVFGPHKREACGNVPVVLFGAGELGREMCHALIQHGIRPAAICDNHPSEHLLAIEGIPIIGFPRLRTEFKGALLVVSSKRFQAALTQQLEDAGFPRDRIKCTPADPWAHWVFLYAMRITQGYMASMERSFPNGCMLARLRETEESLSWIHRHLADQKSRDLLIAKLSFLASGGNLELFRNFIFRFSEPALSFGITNYSELTEDYYYFNNDVLSLQAGETYVDIGAFDGDTLLAFRDACLKSEVTYRQAYAFEPDPVLFEKLVHNTRQMERLTCIQQGLWSETTTLRFRSSGNAVHDQAAAIHGGGDCQIDVQRLDDFLNGAAVSFIKADPGGNIIERVLEGSSATIRTHRPKLAIAAYQSMEAIYEIPMMIKKMVPEYRVFLRHNTYHLCDTEMYATL